ncbi:hypothetical protein RD792_018000 [Penstemon davidsonii]|uniref:Protein kinase domain-containing protein n=1 Tax=Penstemon davidsonii TaxID=160366 RepID=A0ABR0DVG4_9LAMI|nr:hypothetical protein RD792_018000 [Penstemon davidsonii]
MSPTPTKLISHFTLLYFFTLIFLVISKPTLLPSDHNALWLIHRDFNIPHAPARNPCDSTGIFCELRMENHTSVLRITRLVFESKQIKGRLSPAIGKLSELKELSLSQNQLFDQIPSQIVHCHKLAVLNLGKNQFSGKIPSGLSSLIHPQLLDLSSNKIVGSLGFLKYFPNLENLDLADNMFVGKVPLSLKSFRNLRFINVSGNSLVDSTHVPLLSQIEENTPKRYVFVETSNDRNQSFHSAMSPSSSQESNGAEAPSPTGTPLHHKHHKNHKRKIVGSVVGFLAGVLVGSISGFLFSFLFRFLVFLIRGRSKDSALKIFSPMIKKPEDLAFLEKEDGLASLDIIGRGGCGEVYKAVLPGSNGKEIAIKKIIQPPREVEQELADEDSKLLNKKLRQIRSEIQTVGQIRHRNLVPLLAHLPRHDCHFLVYEYMKNGSLQDYLQHVAEGRAELNWLARYKIALGVAAGLEYLHISHTPTIIHRDLKPANILLDDEMEARIADFGLAKAVPDTHTHVTTSNVKGTVGYIAPEYYQTNKFTDKCDVYSFGVVLGVLVKGKLPSDDFFQHTDEMSLVKWMRNVMTSDEPQRAIDERLLGNGYEEQMLLVLKVACFCTLDNPKERPNSKDARCMLSQIKH